MVKLPHEVLGDQRKGVSLQCEPETFGIAPAPSSPSPDLIERRLELRLHRHPGQISVDRELIGEIREAAAELSRLRAAYLFDGLPPYNGEWDGHDTPEKYRRLSALATPVSPAPDAWSEHVNNMMERVGPEIEADLRKQAKTAARLRRGEPAIGWKAMFETEQTLREAWTKRAMEAEAELATIRSAAVPGET